ncbi:MAG: hypothetical protein M1837_005977 [Sclerophora amabilis]|nr:MAG: hypothetical protein M1837_005977 [Sclerophora amabilis]
MARRRQKRRTHVGSSNNKPANGKNAAVNRSPKSMVICMGAGEAGPSVSQLSKDVRAMMEPDTASRLKERRSNKLKDFTIMAGPLGVSHLLLFSRSSSGNTNLRLALTPRGPTLHFRVERYSLCKDVRKAMRHPKGGRLDYRTPPLLVMNNFTTTQSSESTSRNPIPKHLESLSTSVFQSLFPAISPQNTPLPSIRRVLLLNREPAPSSPSKNGAEMDSADSSENNGTYVLNLRHYAITTRATDVSRPIRRLNAADKKARSFTQTSRKRGGIPDLGKLDDVADYILDPSGAAASGFTSGSESEVETDGEVEVLETNAKKVLSRQKREQLRARASAQNKSGLRGGGEGSLPGVEKRAVKLVELGPRMKLRMTKVEEGVCGGKVMWHEFVTKTEQEAKAMEKVWERRNKEKEERKRVQRNNVERKREEKSQKGSRGKDGKEAEAGTEVDKDEDEDEEDWDSEMFDDDDDDDVDDAKEGENGVMDVDEEDVTVK